MGHQLNFYLTDSDNEMIETVIRSIEPVAVLHRRAQAPSPRVLPALRLEEDGQAWLFLNLVRLADLDALPFRHVPGPDYWTTDTLRSPVLEFNRGSSNGETIRPSRIYFIASYFGEDDMPVTKDEAFIAWGKKVIRRVRSALVRHGSFYIGPEAKALVEAGQVSLQS